MKNQFTFFTTFVFLFLSLQLQAQTKIIAHKSHSGKAATFNVFSEHNFGLSPIVTTDTVIHVSDSIFVAIMHEQFSKSAWRDTVRYTEENKHYYYRHIYLGKSIDVLKEEMPNTVFIGFEREDEQEQDQNLNTNQNFNPRQNIYFYPTKSKKN